jgi:hypothetical protein
MMEDAATDRAKPESMAEAIQASQKRIKVLEASPKPLPPPPPPPPPYTNVSIDTKNRGHGVGILPIPQRASEMGMSYSAPATHNFVTSPFMSMRTGQHRSLDVELPGHNLLHQFIPHKHLPKLDFPKFTGDNPKIWKKKCETYFDVFSVPDHLQTKYATLNFTDKAALWLETIEAKGRIERWVDLCHIVFDRWDKDHHSITMRHILAIRQIGSVADYIESLDDLRHQILLHDPSTSDVFFVSRFLEGLKDDIRSIIALHRPFDMDIVSSLAMMQEEENENGRRKSHTKHDVSSRYSWKSSTAADKTKETKKMDDIAKSDDKVSSLLAYRKSKGLCYKCGDKWGKGHTLSSSSAFACSGRSHVGYASK